MKTKDFCYDCKKDITYEDYAIFDVNAGTNKNANWKDVCFDCTSKRHDRKYW
jgi:hypothetical protein|tara:strand:+ start:150 stop:305 length:156 start_codon:yes stop_codon:yes gene_type:complete